MEYNYRNIYKIYFVILFLLAIPLLSLLLSNLHFWPEMDGLLMLLFLVGMAPCGGIGFVLSLIGYFTAKKNKDSINVKIGVVGMIFSGLMTVFGAVILVLIAVGIAIIA